MKAKQKLSRQQNTSVNRPTGNIEAKKDHEMNTLDSLMDSMKDELPELARASVDFGCP